MLSFYRGLLYLYPSHYRREFADEMVCVFREAEADLSPAAFNQRIAFRVREISGLLAGAMRERLRVVTGSYQSISFTRFNMRPEFRFPRSTVVLMSVILAGVLLAMEKANIIQNTYAPGEGSVWQSLPGFLVLTFLFTSAVALIVLGIRFARGRAGVQRLANIEPDSKRLN